MRIPFADSGVVVAVGGVQGSIAGLEFIDASGQQLVLNMGTFPVSRSRWRNTHLGGNLVEFSERDGLYVTVETCKN